MTATTRTRMFMIALTSVIAGCAMPSGPASSGAPIRGSWRLVGTQRAPSAAMEGLLVVEAQEGDLISGRASWEERDAMGIVRQEGGALSGRVVGSQDVDFDVSASGVTRRHVGRLRADTIEGSWIQISDGRTGTFRAVREP